jgi:BirA family biotin operon repressor/biotin-[acetyl-CoA-carboxylase] ligase
VIDPHAPVVRFAEIDSTNAEAARRAAAGDLGPVWLRADRQSAGRGRRGRTWASPLGNLFLTYLGPTHAPPADVARLGFCAALAVADLADSVAGAGAAQLKWPNDVQIGGRKLSGILLESGRAPSDGWFALGIGVNLIWAPDDVEQPVSALSELGDAPSADAATAFVVDRLGFWSARYVSDGFALIRDAWVKRAIGLGGRVVARLGAETIEGVAEALTDDGALRLRLSDGGARAISAGEIFLSSHPV